MNLDRMILSSDLKNVNLYTKIIAKRDYDYYGGVLESREQTDNPKPSNPRKEKIQENKKRIEGLKRLEDFYNSNLQAFKRMQKLKKFKQITETEL